MSHALVHTRPNWLLRGLILASAAFHLLLILHVTGVLRVDTYTKIEVKMSENQPPARALPRPRLRPSEVREPSTVNPLDVPRAAMPIPQPREVAPAPKAGDLAGEGWAPPKVVGLPGGGLLPGGAGLGGAEMEAYQEMVRARIEREKKYPPQARRRQEEGRVTLHFTVGSDGRLANLSVVRSSRSQALDEAAQEAVRRGAPYPAPPGHLLVGGGMALEITIAFELS